MTKALSADRCANNGQGTSRIDCLEGDRRIHVPEPARRRALRSIEPTVGCIAANQARIVAPRFGFVPHLGSA